METEVTHYRNNEPDTTVGFTVDFDTIVAFVIPF
jgi:hypothetical protein